MSVNKLYTVTEAANAVGMKRETLNSWIANHELKPGSDYLVVENVRGKYRLTDVHLNRLKQKLIIERGY